MVANTGWAMLDEGSAGRSKWGYVSYTPGSDLRLRVNTLRPDQPPALDGSPPDVSLVLAYLRSYNHMGCAELRWAVGGGGGEGERGGGRGGIPESRDAMTTWAMQS